MCRRIRRGLRWLLGEGDDSCGGGLSVDDVDDVGGPPVGVWVLVGCVVFPGLGGGCLFLWGEVVGGDCCVGLGEDDQVRCCFLCCWF